MDDSNMNDIRDVAKLTVHYCRAHNYELDTVKLQALLYYIQWASLKYNNKPCFDEDPIADRIGPIFPTVYEQYETYTSSDFEHENHEMADSSIDHDSEIIIEAVCKRCGTAPTWAVMNAIKQTASWRNRYLPYEKRKIE